ncbi:MAG TPA: glycosyltransferase 87 family protein, partial [Sporichthyaceae bacterium]|nr:glycosyltransferase 87 family protein [Sporichthyaceae bacterium]
MPVPIDRYIPVWPTRDDPTIAAGCEVLGGPMGRRAAPGGRWWTPLRVVLALAILCMALGVVERDPCRSHSWSRADGQQYAHACYSDIPHLYRERGFADNEVPYFDHGDHQPLEYPVLTGAFMWAAAEIVKPLAGAGIDVRAVRFYDVNAVLLGLAALVAVAATMGLAGRRPWDAALVAASPVLMLDATINWDLFAVALTSLSMLAWARRRPGLAGVLLGLAVSAKFYPVVLLVPFGALCLRGRRLPEFGRLLAGGIVAWVVVNLPVAFAATDGWKEFYTFSAHRGADFGSVWYVLAQAGHPVGHLNTVTSALTIAGLAGVAALTWFAPAPPRLAQLAFLAVAVFILANKVWSPQYALWLLPLAALARPRWRDLLIWQAGETVYFVGVWLYLLAGYDRGLSQNGYGALVVLRLASLLYLVVLVVRDAL